MDKKYLIIPMIILAVLLVIFFFPKQNNIWDDTFTAEARSASQYRNMDCTCIGFTAMDYSHSKSDTQVQLCYGIPTNCVYACKQKINDQWQDISCDELS